MAPHTTSATPEQIAPFLDEHKDLARGRLRSIEGKVQAKRLWDDYLCNSLNSMGGCTKTVQQWQKVWFDRKHLAKKPAADSRRSASSTGGGPSTAPQLSQWELKVLSIMGDGFGERQTGARVPAFSEPHETLEGMPSTSSQTPFILEPSLNFAEDNEPARQLPASQTLSQESATNLHSSELTPRNVRRRRAASGSGLSSRLIKIEEERREREIIRNMELAGIKTALVELCRLIAEFLNR